MHEAPKGQLDIAPTFSEHQSYQLFRCPRPLMAQVQTLKPNVTREEAICHFTNGVLNSAVEMIRGPVRSLAEFYIPYRLFQVRIRSGGREQTQTFAMDAVRGVLDLFQLPALTADDQFLTIQTRNVLPAGLDAKQAEERLIAKVRRMIFTRGFFRVRDLNIEVTPLSGEIWSGGGLAALGRRDIDRFLSPDFKYFRNSHLGVSPRYPSCVSPPSLAKSISKGVMRLSPRGDCNGDDVWPFRNPE